MTDLVARPARWRALHGHDRDGDAGSRAFAGSGLLAVGARRLGEARLRTRCGRTLPFSPARWHAPAADEEVTALARVRGPVLDLACGPGRLVDHLRGRGVAALGVDAAPDAVAAARRRGVPALLADLWEALPMEGAWRTLLLFDGNIGIGARPPDLLQRCGQLLAPGGSVVAEVGPPGTVTLSAEARIEWCGWHSPWFPWSTVAADDIAGVASAGGFEVARVHGAAGRSFAHLVPLRQRSGLAA